MSRLYRWLFRDVIAWEEAAAQIADPDERALTLGLISVFRSNRQVALIMAPVMLLVALGMLVRLIT